MIKALIVDDEAPARERLVRMASDIEDLEVIGVAENGKQAVELIEELSPDLVFLDVQMPCLNGFEVIESISRRPRIVFVTAYDEYALRAFEVNAMDYLLKPFNRQRLEESVRRAEETLARDQDTHLSSLLKSLASEGQYLTRLAVQDGFTIRVLAVQELDWIGIEGKQVVVHQGQKIFPIRRTLSELEARLDPAHFFRTHRSCLVNLDKVKEIVPWFNWSYRLRLTNGEEVDLSRTQARALRKIIKW
jgi:two-component system LytT family response regulator